MPHKHGRQTAGHTRQEAMKKPYHTISHGAAAPMEGGDSTCTSISMMNSEKEHATS